MLPVFSTTSFISRLFAAAFALILIVASSSLVRAETVKDVAVQYVGEETVARSVILAQIRTKVGSELDSQIITEDIKSLYDSGHVESVRVLNEAYNGGARVIFLVQTRATLGEVAFIGNSLTSTKLRKETELEIGDPFDDTQLENARLNLEDYYKKKGFSDVSLSYRVDGAEQSGFSRVTFVINEGTKERLNKIRFYGNEAISDNRLADQMQVKEQKIYNIFKRNRGIDTALLEEDVIRIEEHYRDEGFLNARVTDVTREPAGDKVDLLIHISEGEKYSINNVRVTGIEAVSEADVLSNLIMQSGAIYSSKGIKADIKGLRKYYGNNGYSNVRVMPRISSAGGTLVDIEYDVAEGVQTSVDLINISGNDGTSDKVIRRELAISPGDVYNQDLVEVSRNRLMGLGYFDNVDVTPTASSTPFHTDINIDVREKSTGSVNFGVGLSSIDSIVGFIDVVQTNFKLWGRPKLFGGKGMTGAGQKLRIGIKAGPERKDFQLDFTEPWLFDRKLAFSTGFYYRDLLFLSDYYEQTNGGIYFGLRKSLTQTTSLSTKLNFEGYDISVDSDASDELKEEEGKTSRGLFALTYVWDTRDSQYLTRRGHRVNVGLDTSFGDTSNVGFQLSGAKYFHLPFDTVFSVNGAFRTVDGDTPIYDREFLGGANNLRGYEFREASGSELRDENGEPLGGGTSAFFTAEYSFPVFNLRKLRSHVFYDGGVVSAGSWDVGGSYLADVGIGIDYFLPVGPIRIDLAWPLVKDEYTEDSVRVQFNMGYRF
jgi:outer membrane protein insertion porin family